MSDLVVAKLSRFSAEIDKIQLNIENINVVTDEAISYLEDKKKALRSSVTVEAKTIQQNIKTITSQHDKIVEKLTSKHTEVQLRKASIDQLDFAIAELDREISRIQAQRDNTIFELEKKKSVIRDRLRSIENLDILIKRLNDQIYSSTHDYEKEMADLQNQRLALLARTDLTPSEMALALAELDRKIANQQQMHEDYLQSLQQQRDESLMKLRQINMDVETAAEMKNNLQDDINALEAMKIGASPSEIEEINRKIARLKQQMDEIDFLRELNERGLRLSPSGHIITASGRILTLAEAIAAGLLDGMDTAALLAKELLKERGLELTPSGRIRTKSGRILTMEEAKRLGLLEGIDTDALQRRPSGVGSIVSISTEESVISSMTTEDVQYLKTVIGTPLTLALAEICSKQPRDPIHYLGHWLFKYRYNQEVDAVKKVEIEKLLAERDRIQKETWHREIEEAAKDAVLEMVFKAHDEVVKKELEEIAKMEEMLEAENDELAEEAKDTLGEYTGPPVGQRANM